MHIAPVFNGHKHAVVVLAFVERRHIVEVEVHNVNLRVVFPEVVAQHVYVVAPIPAHQHQVFAVEVAHAQFVLLRQAVVNGHRAADRFAGNFQPGALAQFQHGFIEDASHYVDGLAEVAEDFAGVFRGVFKGHNLKFHIGAIPLQARPQIHQHLRGRHWRSTDADDAFRLLHGVSGPGDGIFAILDDIPGVLVKGTPGPGEGKAAVRALKELEVQVFFQQVDLLDHRRRGDIQLFRSLVEAARIRHAEEGIELGVVHTHHPFHRGVVPIAPVGSAAAFIIKHFCGESSAGVYIWYMCGQNLKGRTYVNLSAPLACRKKPCVYANDSRSAPGQRKPRQIQPAICAGRAVHRQSGIQRPGK